ncbi:MAG: hypothetical protein RL684_1446 [Pseudomonadota bacterium]|jgi:hypothetical protein
MYGRKGLAVWTAELFFFIALYSVLIFLWAYLLYPAEFEGHVDFDAYFHGNRRVHALLPVAWCALFTGYLFFSSLERIARHFG